MTNEIQFYIKKPEQSFELSTLILSLNCDSIYIHANNQDHAQSLSEILWRYPKDRFIANVMTEPCPQAVILIGYTNIPKDREFIINASHTLLDKTDIEWVIDSTDSDAIHLARERYKIWQNKGFKLSCIK
jgi:DNA polymerase IIIc chi subunit